VDDAGARDSGEPSVAQVSEQVRALLEAAERSAVEVRERAQERADRALREVEELSRERVARVSEAAGRLLEEVTALQAEASDLRRATARPGEVRSAEPREPQEVRKDLGQKSPRGTPGGWHPKN